MSSIPHDLTPEILPALPVKDLLRFRCVSPSWRSLIDSPSFAQSHLSRSLETRSNRFLLDNLKEKIELLDFDSLQKVPEIHQPPIPTEIVGLCNGVVALFTRGEDLSLWNPLTGKLRQLPSPKITAYNSELSRTAVAHGFGYDSETDDYKLVQIAHFQKGRNSPTISKGEVFSLKANTWREIEGEIERPFPAREIFTTTALVNNSLHWVLHFDSFASRILGFGLGKEEFYEVPYPHHGYGRFELGVLGDCLCASVIYYLSPNCELNVWVMKEYGVKESWYKLIVHHIPRLITDHFPPLVIPLTCSGDGKQVLLNKLGHLYWYDLKSKTLDNVHVLDNDHCVYKPIVCMGSLVAVE